MDEALVLSELKKHNYNVSKVARNLDLDYESLKDRFEVKITKVIIPSGPIPSDFKSLGKSGMEKYVIAVKANCQEWPIRFLNTINEARRKYDAGTHEMCQQKRPDGWIVLYLIPRKMRDRTRRPYFFLRSVDGGR